MPNQFPPFEMQTNRADLNSLTTGLTGFAVGKIGKGITSVWLRGDKGNFLTLGVAQHDLQFKFEVFALSLETLERLRELYAAWKPPTFPPDMPENFRRLMSVRPAMPGPPSQFEPWPLHDWRVDVVRRSEFITEDVQVGPTFGSNPNSQSATIPGHVPPDASASCDIAAGLLFTGQDNRVLIGVDWFPMNMVFLQDNSAINAYVADCELVALDLYAQRFS